MLLLKCRPLLCQVYILYDNVTRLLYINVKIRSKQGQDIQQRIRHSCENEDLFENEPP